MKKSRKILSLIIILTLFSNINIFFNSNYVNASLLPEGWDCFLSETAYGKLDNTTFIIGGTGKAGGYENDDLHGFGGNVTKVEVNEGITSIERGAIINFPNLKTVKLPSTLKEIGKEAFYMNSNIENLIIPEGVETIGSKAFYGCYSLKKITLPSTLKSIADDAFKSCCIKTVTNNSSLNISLDTSAYDNRAHFASTASAIALSGTVNKATYSKQKITYKLKKGMKLKGKKVTSYKYRSNITLPDVNAKSGKLLYSWKVISANNKKVSLLIGNNTSCNLLQGDIVIKPVFIKFTLKKKNKSSLKIGYKNTVHNAKCTDTYIQIATNKKFKKAKKIDLSLAKGLWYKNIKYSHNTISIRNLKENKKYYIRLIDKGDYTDYRAYEDYSVKPEPKPYKTCIFGSTYFIKVKTK